MKSLKESFFKNMGVGAEIEKARIEESIENSWSPLIPKRPLKYKINDDLSVNMYSNYMVDEKLTELDFNINYAENITTASHKIIPKKCDTYNLQHQVDIKNINICNLDTRELNVGWCKDMEVLSFTDSKIGNVIHISYCAKLSKVECSSKLNRISIAACPNITSMKDIPDAQIIRLSNNNYQAGADSFDLEGCGSRLRTLDIEFLKYRDAVHCIKNIDKLSDKIRKLYIHAFHTQCVSVYNLPKDLREITIRKSGGTPEGFKDWIGELKASRPTVTIKYKK